MAQLTTSSNARALDITLPDDGRDHARQCVCLYEIRKSHVVSTEQNLSRLVSVADNIGCVCAFWSLIGACDSE